MTDQNDDGFANSVCQRILQKALQELTQFMSEDGHQPGSERFMHRGGIAMSWLAAGTGQFVGALVFDENQLAVVGKQVSENLIGNALDMLSKRLGQPVEVSIAPISTTPGEAPMVGLLSAGQTALHALRMAERCVTDPLQQALIQRAAKDLEAALQAAGVRVIVAKPGEIRGV